MNTQVKQFVTALIALSILNGCASSGPKPLTTYEPTHNFNQTTLFSFADATPVRYVGKYPIPTAANSAMEKSIRTEMEAKGYEYIDNNVAADLLVSYKLKAMDQVRIIKNGEYNAWVWSHGDRLFFDNSFPKPPMEDYVEGSVKIDVLDARTSRFVWRVKATQDLTAENLDAKHYEFGGVAMELLADLPVVTK